MQLFPQPEKRKWWFITVLVIHVMTFAFIPAGKISALIRGKTCYLRLRVRDPFHYLKGYYIEAVPDVPLDMYSLMRAGVKHILFYENLYAVFKRDAQGFLAFQKYSFKKIEEGDDKIFIKMTRRGYGFFALGIERIYLDENSAKLLHRKIRDIIAQSRRNRELQPFLVLKVDDFGNAVVTGLVMGSSMYEFSPIRGWRVKKISQRNR